jgi:hypothetical protein
LWARQRSGASFRAHSLVADAHVGGTPLPNGAGILRTVTG